MVKIELIYIAQDTTTVHLTMDLPIGSTVGDALSQSKIHDTHPETTALAVGIYTKVVSLDTVLREGDRIELYRPLVLDPKEKRRQLARAKNKSR
jgi:uncharacterized protein